MTVMVRTQRAQCRTARKLQVWRAMRCRHRSSGSPGRVASKTACARRRRLQSGHLKRSATTPASNPASNRQQRAALADVNPHGDATAGRHDKTSVRGAARLSSALPGRRPQAQSVVGIALLDGHEGERHTRPDMHSSPRLGTPSPPMAAACGGCAAQNHVRHDDGVVRRASSRVSDS